MMLGLFNNYELGSGCEDPTSWTCSESLLGLVRKVGGSRHLFAGAGLCCVMLGGACGDNGWCAPELELERQESEKTASKPSASPEVWQGLTAGPYRVGFAQRFLTDPAHTGSTWGSPEGSKARRILLNIWWPTRAHGKPMVVGDYFAINVPGAERDSYTLGLERVARAAFAAEVVGTPEDLVLYSDHAVLEEDAEELGRIEVFATSKTDPVPGSFPVVIYHAGYGGAFGENFILAEFLASNGYVVVSSAFPPADDVLPQIGEHYSSHADLDQIVAYAQGAFAPQMLALMGHSYGAQTIIAYAMQNRLVDAVVSLDSTFENREFADAWKEDEARFSDVEKFVAPMLAFGTKNARHFDLYESFVFSRRVYITMRMLEHEDFHSLGGVLMSTHRNKPGIIERYLVVCRETLAFLEAVRDGEDYFPTLREMDGSSRHYEAVPRAFASPTDLARAVLVSSDVEALAAEACRSGHACVFDALETVKRLLFLHETERASAFLAGLPRSVIASWPVQYAHGLVDVARGSSPGALRHLEQARDALSREDGPIARLYEIKTADAIRAVREKEHAGAP